MALSKRERFKAIALGNRPGDVMIIDWFHRCLVETPPVWAEQRSPAGVARGRGRKAQVFLLKMTIAHISQIL